MTTAHPLYKWPARLLRGPARGCLLAGLIAAGLGSATANFAWAAEAQTSQAAPGRQTAWQLSITRAPLGKALLQLAKQAGIQFARFADVDTTQALVGPLSGSYSREEALGQLLQGTGLTYRFVNDRTVAIIREARPASQLPNAVSDGAAGARPGPGGPGGMNGTAGQARGSADGRDERSRQPGFWSRILSFFSGSWQENQESGAASTGVATVFLLCSPMATNCVAHAQAPASSLPLATEELQEVTITGSRVISNGNDSPTPVTVVSLEQLMEVNPGPVAQALAQLPALLATPNQGGQGPGPQAVFNLRGIGGARNLILFDGHRVANTGGGGVDTNLIPSMLLKRVDIVTGGASAVYGSDAVSGVVNYIVDSNFNGVKFTAQTGITAFNDDRTYVIGMAAGMPVFGGRGHIEFSYQNFNDPGIPDRNRRDWGRGLWSAQGSVVGSTANPGSAANPWALYRDTRLNVTNFGGVINTGPLAGLQFAQNGVLSPFAHGVATGSPGAEIGGDGGYYTTVTAFAGQNMDQAFGRFDFSFAGNVKGYAELAATTVLNWTNGANNEIRTRAIGYNNGFLSAVQPAYQGTIAAQRAANPLGTFNFSRIFSQTDAFPAPRNENRGVQYLFLASLDGTWGRYRWSVGYERADEVTNAFQPNNYSMPRLFATMNAVVNPANGQLVCNAALANPSAYGSCVPLNLFGPTASNRAAYDYIRNSSQSATTNLMDDWSASITGAPVSTWAGPVEMALSADWRRQSYRVVSTALPTDPVDCAGIQFNCSPGGVSPTTPYANTTATFPKASLTVGEFAYEFQAPLLRRHRLARDLGINGAVRSTNYETSGTVWSWKLGLAWAASDALALRVARSRDIRAPTLTNLFAPPSVGTSNITDIHTGVTGPVQTRSQGNPELVPEEADTFTAGVVWTPQSIGGFSASMDYYHIRISKGLLGPTPTQPATQQVCEDSGGTSPVCVLYIRPLPFSDHTAANFPVAIQNLTLNTAGLLAYGIDTEVDWVHPIAGHNMKLRFLLNFQPHLIYDLGPGGILDVGGAADGVGGLPATPNVKALLQVSYEMGRNLTATLQERYRNALKQNGSTVLFFAFGKQPPTFYTDLTLNYKMTALGSSNVETFLNVRNVFNKAPDPWASTGGTSQIGSFGGWLQGDDPLGRYYTIGVRYRR